MRTFIFMLLFFACLPFSSYAQSNKADSLKGEWDNFRRKNTKPVKIDCLNAVRDSFLAKIYEYEISAYNHRRNAFDWNHTSSIIIFWIVIIIVFIGLVFSGIQFYISLKREKKAESEYKATTEFEASLQGVKVSSSVLGIVILVISLAFFYLYLVHVYPVQNIEDKPDKKIQTESKS